MTEAAKTNVVKMVETSDSARHKSVKDCLEDAIRLYNEDPETTECQKCAVMFFGHPEKQGYMHWFFAGGSQIERIGWLEYIKSEISKTI